MASGETLFYMWQPVREGFIRDVHFYLDQAVRRVLNPFGNIDEEARRHADEWLAARDKYFDPERDDPGDHHADAYDVEINHSLLVWEMHQNLRLSLIAGLFHTWEKQIRDWLCSEVVRWDTGQHSRRAIWRLDFPKLIEFLESLGWKMKSNPFYKVLDKYRLLVNVYKHGEGPAFEQLRQEYPDFFIPEEDPGRDLKLRYADYTSLIIQDKNLKELATAIEGFWNAIPEYTFESDLQKTPQLFLSAWQKDQAEKSNAGK